MTDQVLERMTDLIVEGQLAANTALPPESDLAGSFGVSRTVVREAVRILASQGLLEVRHGVGTFVNPPPAWRVEEPLSLLLRVTKGSLLRWLEVRTALEVTAVSLAAERATPDDWAVLNAAHAEMRHEVSVGLESPIGFVQADMRFHLGLAAAAKNPLLVCVLRPVLTPLEGKLRETIALLPESPALAVEEHQVVLDRVAAGDGPGSADAMRRHLDRVAGEVDALLRREDS